MKNLLLSVYVSWICLLFVQIQIFKDHVSVLLFIETATGMIDKKGAT